MAEAKITRQTVPLKISFGTILSIAAICLLGWLVSIFHLSYESMWIDEAQTLTTSSQGIFQLVQTIAKDVHPPIYFLWVHFWLNFVGSDNLFILRLSSAVPGIIAVALCYRLTWEWFENRLAALGAASFLATSGLFIYYTRDLRMYPLMMMLTLLSWWMLSRYLKGKTYARWSYAASLVLLAYTFYFAAFMVIAQWLVIIIFFRARARKLFMACVILSLGLLPWLPTFVAQIHEARAQSGDPNAPIIGKFLGTSPTSPESIWGFIQTYTAKQPSYTLLLLTMAILWGLQNTYYRRWVMTALLWLFLTTILFFVINLVFPIYGIRYVLSVLPALAVLIGATLAVLPSKRINTAILGIIIISGLSSQTDGFLPARAPHRELLSTIAAHYLATDRVWYNLNQGALGSTFSDDVKYHLRKDAPLLNPDLFVWNAPKEYLDVKQNPRVWDVRPYWITPSSQTLAPLLNGRVVTEQHSFGAYSVKLYEAPPLDKRPINLGGFLDLLISPQEVSAYQAGQTAVIKTWWHIRQAAPVDYSISLILTTVNAITPVAQQDTSLQIDDKPTSQLAPADGYSYQSESFTLPATLSQGKYDLWLVVYYYADLKRLTISPSPDFPSDNASSMAQIATISISRPN